MKPVPPVNTLPPGNQAFRAANVGSLQALGAGIAYPYTDLQIVSPTGSALHTSSKAASLFPMLPAARTATTGTATSRAASRTYVSRLNLYTPGATVSGTTMTVPYFTDAAGTQSAGGITITLPASGTDPTNYTSYPVQIPITVNITAGNIPCQGTIHLTFTGNSGANTMVGTLTLTKDNVVFQLNLALSDQLAVSGSIIIQEQGATIQVSNISGNLTGTLQCNVAVSPYGWTGTGTLNLLNGQLTMNLNTGAGTAISASDAAGSLDLNYADGTKETVTNAVTAGLDTGNGTGNSGSGSGGGGSGGGGSTSPTYNTPVNLGAIAPTQINNAGQILGLTADTSQVPVFLQSSTALPQKLAGVTQPFQSGYSALSMNSSGQIVGFGGNLASGVIWQNATAQPQTLAGNTPAPSLISDGGVIVGQTYNTFSAVTTAWSDPNTPFTMTSLGIYDTPQGISRDGQIVGWTYKSDQIDYSYWKSYTAAPQALQRGTISTNLSTTSMSVNTSSQICATLQYGGAVYWASPTAPVQYLPGFDSSLVNTDSALGINNSGTIVGSAPGSSVTTPITSYNHAVVWQNLKLQDLNALIPTGTGWTLVSANAINDQGWIVGTGMITVNGVKQTVGFLLTPVQ